MEKTDFGNGAAEMNETQIKCFITAARSASFSEAAEKLFMTPPTFGRHISSLEKELGHPLFVRGWKGLRLTPVGQLMYDGFLEIGDKLDELKTEAERISSGAAGQLNIAILDGQHFDSHLRDVSLYLRRAYPDLQVQLTRGSFREIEEQLLNGKLDLGVTITEEIEQVEDLEFIRLQTLKNRIILPREHPLAFKEDLRLIDLRDTPLLELETGECRYVSQSLEAACIRAGFEPKVQTYPNLNAQLFALEAGLGMMALNEQHTACWHPNLVAREIDGLPEVEFCIAWHTANPNPAVRLFLDNL